ncbi:hypothetical protein [Cellulomonas wangsupingiae]|uniref:hypothetical protein n=1 Tax=Cellulomonas wangsupingiae TaxID=2968085 RepID=UPI001D0F2549|nr:hypothetical protein [Cellulomonas wangsupingiae]MCC2335440.1 hypothetical protein [Cellulomonas wangsupingiae]MCM0640029.1 hypothetical protein [Cellulomonas wangsupingiae]
MVLGGVLGALVGLVVGWLVLRPSGSDLLAEARDLVPRGFSVEDEGLQRGNVLLGWEDVAGVTATGSAATDGDLAVPQLARAAGWTVVTDHPAAADDFYLLERPGLEARVSLYVQGAGSEVWVTVQRDGSQWWWVGATGLAGAAVGAAVVLVAPGRARR